MEERDLALDRAFSRIVSTTDRLLKDENSTVVYSMDSVGRYELPELAEEPVDNQLEYARRISEHLKEQSFETELLYNPERSKDVYLSGRR